MAAMEPRTESATPGAEEDEDDYMNMVIAEPSKPKEKETYTQRRLRKEREVCPLQSPLYALPLRER